MRLRLRSTKLGRVRFVGHRDMARLWDRTLRRLGVPVAFTGGFTPRPRIAFGLALPMGAESLAEYVDVDIDTSRASDAGSVAVHQSGDHAEIDVERLPGELSALLPDGVEVTAAALVDRAADSLQSVVTACTWELWSDELTADRLSEAVGLLDHDELLVTRERKRARRVDDIRPLLLDLRTTGERLVAELATTGRALRPSELSGLAFPDIDPLDVRVLRINQWTSHDGARREVLTPRALPVAAHHREVGA